MPKPRPAAARRVKPLPSIDPRSLVPLPRIPLLDLPDSAARFEDIPELAIEIVPVATLKHLAMLDGKTLEAVAEIVIAILDVQAGDPEREEDQEDCCEIGEDIGSTDRYRTAPPCGRGWSIGDDEDAEEDDAPEDDDSDEADPDSPAFPGNLWPGSEERHRALRAISVGGSEEDDPAELNGDEEDVAASGPGLIDPHH